MQLCHDCCFCDRSFTVCFTLLLSVVLMLHTTVSTMSLLFLGKKEANYSCWKLFVAPWCPTDVAATKIHHSPFFWQVLIKHLDLTGSCAVCLQGSCSSILWTTQRNGGMCSSAPASAPSGWTICAVEPGTRSSWPPRTVWAQGASVRSLRPRPMEEVSGGVKTVVDMSDAGDKEKN